MEASHEELLPFHVCGHWYSANGDIKYLTCDVTSQNHVIEGSCKFLSGSSSWYVTSLPSLVAMGIVVVDICFSLSLDLAKLRD